MTESVGPVERSSEFEDGVYDGRQYRVRSSAVHYRYRQRDSRVAKTRRGKEMKRGSIPVDDPHDIEAKRKVKKAPNKNEGFKETTVPKTSDSFRRQDMQTQSRAEKSNRPNIMCAKILGYLFLSIVLIFSEKTTGGPLFAQSSNGTITGLVTDAQGSVVPGATVAITAVAGNFKTETVASSEGIYTVPQIPPGIYTVLVKADGFTQVKIEQVNISAAGTKTVDASLKVGATTMTVTVTESEPLLTVSSPTLRTTVDQSMSIELPFPERTALGVVMFAPGVTGDPEANDGVGSEIVGAYTGAINPGGGLTIGGSRDGQVAQLVDGSDNTLMSLPRTGVSFSSNSIRSVSVLSVGLPAEYGRSGGGVINQASAAGTDSFHGFLAWRHHDPYTELVQLNTGGAAPTEHMNMFTVSAAGPIPIPFYKRHAFFLVSFEPMRYRNQSWTRRRLMTPDEIAGRFINSYDELNTTILKNQGYAAAVAAPRTGHQFYQFPTNAQGFPIGTQYAKTSLYVPIPNDDLSAMAAQNPITKFIYGAQPTPGSSKYARFDNPDASYASTGYNAWGARGVLTHDNRYNFRIDENVTDRDRVFFRYTSVPVTGARYDYMGPESPLANIPTEYVKSQNMALSYVRTVSSNMVNDVRVTYLHADDTTGPNVPSMAKDFGAVLGLPAAAAGYGMPSFGMGTNMTQIGDGASFASNVNESYTFADDFSIVRGKHSIKFGVDYRAMQYNQYSKQNQYGGNYNPSSYTGGVDSVTNKTYNGSLLAGYFLGLIGNYTVSAPVTYYFRWKYGAAYFQDDWRATPRLTITAGLRYNVETPRMEKNGYQGSFVANGTAPAGSTGAAATGGFAYSGTNGLPDTLWPISYLGLEPRIGFSYLAKSFMTVRASYTLMHAPLTGRGINLVPNLASANSATIGNNGTGGQDPNAWVNLITNPINSSLLKPAIPVRSNTLLESWNGATYLPYVRDQSKNVPYVQLWSLSLQFQLGRKTLIQSDYVGQKGTHLYSTPVPANDPPVSALLAGIAARQNFNATATADQFGNKTSPLQKLRPFPQFNSNAIWTAYDRYSGSNYNSLYLSGRQEMALGLTVMASFSWSKSMDDASSGIGGPGDSALDSYGVIHPQGYSTAGDYSLSVLDIPLHSAVGYVWQLPIGRGKQLFSSAARWLDTVIGGWSTSGTSIIQSGSPLNILASGNGTSAGFFCSTSAPGAAPCNNGTNLLQDVYLRPNIVPGVPFHKPNWKRDPFGAVSASTGGFLNPAAFSIPGSIDNPQFGSAPRTMGSVRNPRTMYWNGSLRKELVIVPDRAKLQLWTDITNVLNHPNYWVYNNTAYNGVFTTMNTNGVGFQANPNFGLINQVSQPRLINLGVSVTF